MQVGLMVAAVIVSKSPFYVLWEGRVRGGGQLKKKPFAAFESKKRYSINLVFLIFPTRNNSRQTKKLYVTCAQSFSESCMFKRTSKQPFHKSGSCARAQNHVKYSPVLNNWSLVVRYFPLHTLFYK